MILSYFILGAPRQRRRKNPPYKKESARVSDGGGSRYSCTQCRKVIPDWTGIAVEDMGETRPDGSKGYGYIEWRAFHIECLPDEIKSVAVPTLASYHTITMKESSGSPGMVEFRLPKSPWDKDTRGKLNKQLQDRLDVAIEFHGGQRGYKQEKKIKGEYKVIHHPYMIAVGKVPDLLKDLSAPGPGGSLAFIVPPEVTDKIEEINSSLKGQSRDITEQLGHIQNYRTKLREEGHQADPITPWQIDGARFLAEKCNALLADEQGLGKTVQAAVALDVESPVLLIVPSVVMINWYRELTLWRPDRDPNKIIIHTLNGKPLKVDQDEDGNPIFVNTSKKFRWPKPGETVITAYTRLPPLSKSEEKAKGIVTPGTILIADEAQNVRGKYRTAKSANEITDEADEDEENDLSDDENADTIGGVRVAGTKRSYKFQIISDLVRTFGGCVWLLTGTPLSNEGDELWRMFSRGGIETDTFGDWPSFVGMMRPGQGKRGRGGKAAKYNWKETIPNTNLLVPAMRKKMLRREKSDQLGIPPKEYLVKDVEISPDDLQRVESVGVTEEDLQAVEGMSEGMLERIVERQDEFDDDDIALFAESQGRGVAFSKIAKVRAILARAKIPAMNKFISDEFEAKDIPVLVFSSHNAPLEALVLDANVRAKQRGDKKAKKWGIILGSTSTKQRQAAVDGFQRGELDGLAVSIRAAGVGLTLTRAKTSVFVDLDWNPSANAQAEDRIHRYGQKGQTYIIKMRANHYIDGRLWDVLARKQEMINATIAATTIRKGEIIPGLSMLDYQAYEKAMKHQLDVWRGKKKLVITPKTRKRRGRGAEPEIAGEEELILEAPTQAELYASADHKFQSGKRGKPANDAKCIVCGVERYRHGQAMVSLPTQMEIIPAPVIRPPKQVAKITKKIVSVPVARPTVTSGDHPFQKKDGGRGKPARDAKCAVCNVENQYHGRASAQQAKIVIRSAPAPVQVSKPTKSTSKQDHKPRKEGRGRPWPSTICVECNRPWGEHILENPYDLNGPVVCPMYQNPPGYGYSYGQWWN